MFLDRFSPLSTILSCATPLLSWCWLPRREADLHGIQLRVWLPKLLQAQMPHLVPLDPTSSALQQVSTHSCCLLPLLLLLSTLTVYLSVVLPSAFRRWHIARLPYDAVANVPLLVL